ncbi:MAG: GAF domain-containing sensor histidine kinase [Cyanobacteria bacterium P01_E01_bin.6]
MDDSSQQHFHQYDGVTMMSTESSVLNPSDSHFGADTEQQRLESLHKLGLLSSSSTPVFDEATQTAAHFLNAPICIFGIMSGDRQHFKAAIGLSRIGLMNDLATSRQMPRYESFCNAVVERRQLLSIEDTANRPEYQHNVLVDRYGIRSYLGVPVITSKGHCIGTLFVMDLSPRTFNGKDIAFLELIARWSMSEFEKNQLIPSPPHSPQTQHHITGTPTHSQPEQRHDTEISLVKASLIAKMSQELRTPLTSIIGMTSVLMREIYGPLTEKQKEYMDIVHGGSQYMHSLVSEIVELDNLKEDNCDLDLSQVDIEMLCQQALSTLEDVAQRREQTIRLTVEPGQRLWLLDKNKVRQLLYHLVFRVIQSSAAGSTIRVHVSRKEKHLNLSIWTSHLWLDDSSSHADAYVSAQNTLRLLTQPQHLSSLTTSHVSRSGSSFNEQRKFSTPDSLANTPLAETQVEESETRGQIRQNLGLVLSQKLATLHGGSIALQGTSDSGYRYVIVLPRLESHVLGNDPE